MTTTIRLNQLLFLMTQEGEFAHHRVRWAKEAKELILEAQKGQEDLPVYKRTYAIELEHYIEKILAKYDTIENDK